MAAIRVTAVDGNGNQIDIPYYLNPAGGELDSENDGSGLYSLTEHLINLAGGTPKDEWPVFAGVGVVNTFIGASTCDSEPWPWHTMSYPIDRNCWTLVNDVAQDGDLTGASLWDVWVPTTVTDAAGQTLDFVGCFRPRWPAGRDSRRPGRNGRRRDRRHIRRFGRGAAGHTDSRGAAGAGQGGLAGTAPGEPQEPPAPAAEPATKAPAALALGALAAVHWFHEWLRGRCSG